VEERRVKRKKEKAEKSYISSFYIGMSALWTCGHDQSMDHSLAAV